eukprot:m.13273 g.13273  ORF g.13273 m.13273 type:complete len:426 (-) comp4825_c0_seq1:144-1421(-)
MSLRTRITSTNTDRMTDVKEECGHHMSEAARKAVTYLVFACTMADYIAVGMMRIMLPWYAQRAGGGAVLLGSLETAYGVGQVIGASFMGRLSDFYGRRLVVMISFTGSTVGYAMAGMATGTPLLIASRLPVGLAKQTVTVSRAILADISPPRERTGMMTKLMGSIAVGYAIGPVAGAQLASYLGDQAPAFAASALFLLLMIIMYCVLEETCPNLGEQRKEIKEENNTSKPAVSMLSLLRNPRVLLVVLCTTAPELALIIYSTTGFSVFAMQVLHANKEWLGWHQGATASCAAISAIFLLPTLSKRYNFSDHLLLTIGYVGFAITCLGFALAPSRLVTWILVPLLGLSVAIMRSCPASFASKCVDKADQGAIMGLLDGVSSACRVFAPIATGFLISMTDQLAPFYVCAVLCLIGSHGLTYVPREKK